MSWRSVLLVCGLAASAAGCGGAPAPAAAPVDEDRIARRIADEIYERLAREGRLECPSACDDEAIGEDVIVDDEEPDGE